MLALMHTSAVPGVEFPHASTFVTASAPKASSSWRSLVDALLAAFSGLTV